MEASDTKKQFEFILGNAESRGIEMVITPLLSAPVVPLHSNTYIEKLLNTKKWGKVLKQEGARI